MDDSHPSQDLVDGLVAPLRADVVSGAAEVARAACRVVRQALAGTRSTTPERLCGELGDLACRIIEAQPAMAPLVRLLASVLEAAGEADTAEGARRAARRAVERFLVGAEVRARVLAGRGAALLPAGGRILTVSRSSSVLAALVRAGRARDVRVVCLEGRPGLEGRTLAAALARAGLGVTLAVDAAVERLADGCDLVLLGADSIGDSGVVNKIGTVAAAEAARRAGVPVHVLADETKLLPLGFPQPLDGERPPGEVWDAPPGVGVWNRYFEILPTGAVDSIVTERATMDPVALARHRAGLAVPAQLDACARRDTGAATL